MKRVLFALSVLTVAACAQQPLVLSADPRITVLPTAGVFADAPVVTVTQAGTMDISVPLRNRTNGDVAVQCLTDWFTQAGQPIRGLSQFPTRADMGVAQQAECRTVSPTRNAAGFRMLVQPAN